MTGRRPKARIIGWAIVVAGAFVLGGSVLYWLADGAVGTPQQFQDRVAEAGLVVEWRNVGPRAGDGRLPTISCPAGDSEDPGLAPVVA